MKSKINVLHLSDLHFGVESKEISPTASAQRENALKDLQNTLNTLENEWKPNIVVISGDIGWKGHENDYKDAKRWLKSLLNSLGLTANDLVLSAGNHDIERKAATGMKPPTTPGEADDWLKIENLGNFIRPFASYTNFHKTFGIPDLIIGDSASQLIGCRVLKEIKFIVLNSAWFSRGKEDRNNLWIGLPQLEILRNQGCLLDESNYNQSNITIAVLHHPEAWLNEADQKSYENRPCTYSFLSKGCHVILSGHTHGTIESPDRKNNHAYLFTGGSTYTSSDYRNNFSILQIDIESRTLDRKAYEFDPRYKKWVVHPDDKSYPLSLQLPSHRDAIRENELIGKQTDFNYSLLRQRAKDHALRYIEQKSRTIARTTTLPKIIERKVAVHNREEKIIHRQDGTIFLNVKDNLAPFSEMVASVHPIFLFGDLGSGKSTLVGDYIIKLIEANLDLIPILIPARYFLNKEIDTAATLSQHVSDFVKNQIDTTQMNFDLQTVLEDMQEVTLVIDGFDELDKGLAQDLLLRTEDLSNHWSRLRAICTGRPIELRGLNYNNWQCLEMVPLTREEQKQLFLNEAFAEGLEGDEAERDANDKMVFLESNPELLNIATTPLTVRLIRSHLEQSNQTKSVTPTDHSTKKEHKYRNLRDQ